MAFPRMTGLGSSAIVKCARHARIALALVTVTAAGVLPLAAAALDDKQLKEIRALHWQKGTVQLTESHGTFAVPARASILTGGDAQREDDIINGWNDANCEAVMIAGDRRLILTYDDSGYVTADDWRNVDADKKLADIRTDIEDANAERAKNGRPATRLDGWVQPPVYDAAHATLRYMYALHQDNGTKWINAVALVLGRHGYERFVLATDGKNPAAERLALAAYVKDYTFDHGFRFSDYVQGDKVAGYGLAALVGAGGAAALAKTGAFAAILLLAKKFIFIILAAGAALVGGVRRLFPKRAEFGPPAKTPPTVPGS
jgi:uncharacterized membrane-anchored protein